MDDARQVRRRQITVTLTVAAALVGLVIVGLYLSDPSRRLERVAEEAESTRQYRTPGDGIDPSAVWMTRSEGELRTLRRDNQELRQQLSDLEKSVARLRQRPPAEPERRPTRSLPPLPVPSLPADDAVAPTVPGVARDSGQAPRLLPLPAPPSTSRTVGRPVPGGLPQAGILVVDLQASSGTTAPASRHHVRHYLPAGSFMRAVLLSGLDAPTGGVANVNPHPVLLRLADHGTLPNRFRSRVKECFVTAAGYGDISSERAYLRLERLSCVLESGQVVEATVKGYVSGEDGKTGVRGRLVSKQGQIIAKSLLVGLAGGIGSGLAQSMTATSTSALGQVQSVDPQKLLQYGVSQGASSALDRIAEWYLQRANETYPIIEIDAGRTVDVVLTEGVDLGADILPQQNEGDSG